MKEHRVRSDSEALNDAEAEAEAERSRACTKSATVVARAPPRRVASPTGVQAVEDATIFADIIEQMKHTELEDQPDPSAPLVEEPAFRGMLTEWMCAVGDALRMHNITVHVATRILDRFVRLPPCASEKWLHFDGEPAQSEGYGAGAGGADAAALLRRNSGRSISPPPSPRVPVPVTTATQHGRGCGGNGAAAGFGGAVTAARLELLGFTCLTLAAKAEECEVRLPIVDDDLVDFEGSFYACCCGRAMGGAGGDDRGCASYAKARRTQRKQLRREALARMTETGGYVAGAARSRSPTPEQQNALSLAPRPSAPPHAAAQWLRRYGAAHLPRVERAPAEGIGAAFCPPRLSRDTLRAMELAVLERLHWRVGPSLVTPLHYLGCYLRTPPADAGAGAGAGGIAADTDGDSCHAGCSGGRAISGLLYTHDFIKGVPLRQRSVAERRRFELHLSQYATFFADVCLQEYAFSVHRPSLLAAAIAYVTRRACYVRPLWRVEHAHTVGFDGQEREFIAVTDAIWSHFRRAHPTAFSLESNALCDKAHNQSVVTTAARPSTVPAPSTHSDAESEPGAADSTCDTDPETETELGSERIIAATAPRAPKTAVDGGAIGSDAKKDLADADPDRVSPRGIDELEAFAIQLSS